MASTYSDRNRVELQGTGENTNTWGSKLNSMSLEVIDAALDGVEAYALSGSKTLTSTNATESESVKRVQHITSGTGGTITIPAVEKMYIVKNDASGTVTFGAGGTTADVAAGTMDFLFCDGTDVYAANYASGGVSDGSITNSKLADMNASTIKGKITSAGTPEDLTAAQVKTILSLVPGTNVQAYSANTNAVANATTAAANTMLYWTSSTQASFATLTSFGRTLLATVGESDARTTIGVAIGSDVQAHDDGLDDIAGLAPSNSYFIVGDGSNWVRETGSTVRTSLGLGSIATKDITVSTSAASGTPGDGDLWVRYTP